ncbi:MAG TPA: hypothetical protein VEI97_09485 [bacterium]|nr:hypothetical protein [bacterium]
MPTAETRPLGDAVKEQASSFLNSLVNPEGARLERRLRKAQIALAQAAAEHLPELEGTGHYEHLTALLGRAQGLLELARAIETTPTEMIPTTPKAWESPEDASFLGRLSKGAAALLTQAGGWLKHAGGKLEAGRCWLEAAALLSEAGAILAGVYGVEAHYPSWAAGPMEEIRRTVRDLEDTQTGAGGVRPTEKVRARAQ